MTASPSPLDNIVLLADLGPDAREGKVAWQPILCETNTTKGVVQRLQVALKDKGFDPGRVDGVIGSETMRAVTAYQKSKQQPSGQLTLETLKSLDVSL